MHNQDNGEPANPDTLAPPSGSGRRSPRWWLAVQSALIAYGLTLGAALVTMALLVLGFFLGGAGALNAMNTSASSMGASLDGPSALAIYPFFLAAMALGGTTVLTVSSSVYTDLGAPLVSVWVGVLPLLLTAVAAASLWRLGRRAERKAPLESDGLRWLYAGVTGLALAAFSVALSLLVSLRGDAEAGAAFLTAASPSLLTGAILLGTAASWAGRKREAGTGLRWFTRAEAALPGLRAALRITGCHYVAYTFAAGLALLVTSLLHGGAAVAFAAPLWLPTASAWAFTVGHLSAVANPGMPLSGAFPFTVGSLPVWASAASGVLAILLATAVSVLWFLSRGRNPGPAGRRSWLTLPVVFGLGGAALSVLTLLATGQGIAGGSSFGPGAGTIGPAWWTFLIMACWGLLIEAGSRTLAPQLAHLVPRRISAFFAGAAAK